MKNEWDERRIILHQKWRHQDDLLTRPDYANMSRIDRLKRCGLTYARLVGLMAQATEGRTGPVPPSDESVDILADVVITYMGAANALQQRPGEDARGDPVKPGWREFASAAGRFADACEKSDHLEAFVEAAKAANRDVMRWVLVEGDALDVDVFAAARRRRDVAVGFEATPARRVVFGHAGV